MPSNNPIGNDPAQVERDAQLFEVNRALSAIRIAEISDFAIIAEGLQAIVENRPLPNINNQEMKQGLENIQAFFEEPCQWVANQDNKAAFYRFARELINERITLYKRLAQANQQEAALRYIQEEENRRTRAQETQDRLRNVPQPTGEARTLGMPEERYLAHEFRHTVGSRLRANPRRLFIFSHILTGLLVLTAFVLSLLFVSWIGGSILIEAGWKGVFTGHQLVNYSISVAGAYALMSSAWNLYVRYKRPPQTREDFLGYQGVKSFALKAGIFYMAASVLAPLVEGVMNGSVYGFSMVSVAIGLPLASIGFVLASYLIIVNITALFAIPVTAAELSMDHNYDTRVSEVNDHQDMHGLMIRHEDESEVGIEPQPAQNLVTSGAATTAPVLVTRSREPSVQIEPSVQVTSEPLSPEALREKRLAYFSRLSQQ